MRPGRLDRILFVGPPDQAGIEEILRIKIKNMSVENTLNLSEMAELVSFVAFASQPSLDWFIYVPIPPYHNHSAKAAREQRSPQCVKKLLFLKCPEILMHSTYAF